MRSILISAALLSAVAAAGPAAAQYDRGGYDQGYGQGHAQGYRHGGGNIQRQLDQIVERIRRAESRDRISRREASRLLRQADRIGRLHDRYRRNGLNPSEYRDLQHKIDNLRRDLHEERWEGRRDGRHN